MDSGHPVSPAPKTGVSILMYYTPVLGMFYLETWEWSHGTLYKPMSALPVLGSTSSQSELRRPAPFLSSCRPSVGWDVFWRNLFHTACLLLLLEDLRDLAYFKSIQGFEARNLHKHESDRLCRSTFWSVLLGTAFKPAITETNSTAGVVPWLFDLVCHLFLFWVYPPHYVRTWLWPEWVWTCVYVCIDL